MLSSGIVTPDSARIWVRADAAGSGDTEIRWQEEGAAGAGGCVAVDLDDADRDHTGSVLLSDLRPDARYRVTLQRRDGAQLASGRFRTHPAPDRAPQRFAIGLVSCHQPFSGDGRVRASAQHMLEAACAAFEAHEVRQLVLAGDQVYSDMPGGLSLFDDRHFRDVAPPGRGTILECSDMEVRRLFQQRYRHFWSVPGWRDLMSRFPCSPMIDDHDIVDNWGSAEDHQTDAWQSFFRGARWAYCDYQHTLVSDPVDQLPANLDYQLELADTATYFMDLRSNRRVGADPRIVSDTQMADLERFLDSHRARPAVFVVLSVPLVHLPMRVTRLLARVPPDGEDFSDRWSSRGHARDRDAILRLLHAHQASAREQRIVLLSGDIHIGCLHRIRWQGREPNLYQFISSGITNDAGALVQVLSGLLIRGNRGIDVAGGLRARLQLVGGEGRRRRNPCARLNFGIVEVTRRDPGDRPTLRFLLFSHRKGRPELRYRSPPLAT